MNKLKHFWHSSNIGNPEDYAPHSNKKLLWQCPTHEDHQWMTSISKITSGSGCPFCSGRKIAKSNSIEITHPHLLKEWNYKKNKDLKPCQVGYGQSKYVWWICEKGHEWNCTVNNRTNFNSKCPFCLNQKVSLENSIFILNPDLAKEWHEKNKLSPKEVSLGSNKKIWWQCQKNLEHIWQATPSNRKNKGCPFCCGKKICSTNSLEYLHKDLCKEWHEKNIILPNQVTPGSSQKIWWKCSVNSKHEWCAPVCSRTSKNKHGCPFCRESRGEFKIKEFLDANNIYYERQFKIEECKNKFPLRFDFGIRHNSKLILLEYNGKQHYQSSPYFGGEIGLEKTQKNDKIKLDYCYANKIDLIVISYKKFNKIDSILAEKLLGASTGV